MPPLGKRKTTSSYIAKQVNITDPVVSFLVGIFLDDDSLISLMLTCKSIKLSLSQKFAQRIFKIKEYKRTIPVAGGNFARRGFVVPADVSLIKAKKSTSVRAALEPCPKQPPIGNLDVQIVECYFHDAKGFAMTLPKEREETDFNWTFYCWDVKSSNLLWSTKFEYKQKDYIRGGTPISFLIDPSDNTIWISRVEEKTFVISQHSIDSCKVIKSKSFSRVVKTRHLSSPSLAMYDKFVIFLNRKEAKLVLLDKATLEEVQSIAPLPKEKRFNKKMTTVKNFKFALEAKNEPAPLAPEEMVGRQQVHYLWGVEGVPSDEEQDDEDDNNDKSDAEDSEGYEDEEKKEGSNNESEKEDDEEDEESEKEEDEESKEDNEEPADDGTFKKEMGLICISPITSTDGSTQVRIVWAWGRHVQVAIFQHTANKFLLQKQVMHKIHFNCSYDDNDEYDEMLGYFCESRIYLQLYENDLIISVDVHGDKGSSSFVHIVDLYTGKFLWRYDKGELVWFVQPSIYEDTLYIISGDSGEIIALDLKNRSYSIIWLARWEYPADDDHDVRAYVCFAKNSPEPAMFIHVSSYDLPARVYCINRKTGELYWEYLCDIMPTDQFVQGNTIYVGTYEKPIIALQPSNKLAS